MRIFADMADNYLENKFEEFERSKAKTRFKAASLDSLLLKNRSTRGYSKERVPSTEELEEIVAVNTRIASSQNRQELRFMTVSGGPVADFINKNIKMGALFRARRAADPSASERDCPSLPLPGTEPSAFIVVFGTHAEDPSLLIDLGISLQSMGLKSVEKGYNCLMIRAFNREAMSSLLPSGMQLFPLAVLAVGKSAERIFLLPTKKSPLEYFRKEGIHYVPKLGVEELLIQIVQKDSD